MSIALASLDCAEEALVEEALAEGRDVACRQDASPAAVLSVMTPADAELMMSLKVT